jgi:hypothetical protein
MKAMNQTVLFSTVLFILMAVAGSASHTIPLLVDQVQVEDVELTPDSVNRLDLERNQEFDVEVHLRTIEDVSDVEIRAFISGFEYNDVQPISDHIGPFDFDANITYVKHLKLTLPDEVDEDDYKLRIVITDRNGGEVVENYNLKVDVPRHALKIEDVVLSPSGEAKAGTALLATVRLENKGEKDEEDVKVMVSVPELGISATEYLDEIESDDDEEETEEIFLRLPKCAEPGQYMLKVEVWYNEGHDKVTGATKLSVVENESCKPEPAPQVVVSAPPTQTNETAAPSSISKVRSALEVILLVLVALLVIVGLVIGFSRLKGEE